MKKSWLAPLVAMVLAGCGTPIPPKGIHPVTPFDLQTYLGTWYELARLDHSFERGLEQVRAEYSMNQDGSVRVVNTGYRANKKMWKSVEGRAQFVGSSTVASLKVSFFGPFYGGYHVFALDPARYALVTSGTRDYLWILARNKTLAPAVQSELLEHISVAGFETNALIWVKQN